LEKTGLASRVSQAVVNIDVGRKGFATRGQESEGRIFYEEGITNALSAFQEAWLSDDPQIIILAEYTFLIQELAFCDESDKDSQSSLTQAIQSFDDAFSALKTVENKTLYQGAETTYPHNPKYRVGSYPKDSFHIACISHRTRLQNVLRSPGIDAIEKALLKQRYANLPSAQSSYLEKQEEVLE
jgi:hypothetical protein